MPSKVLTSVQSKHRGRVQMLARAADILRPMGSSATGWGFAGDCASADDDADPIHRCREHAGDHASASHSADDCASATSWQPRPRHALRVRVRAAQKASFASASSAQALPAADVASVRKALYVRRMPRLWAVAVTRSVRCNQPRYK
jgi:hypothetical protein